MTIALYITGGGKHVHKPAEGSSARKSFALLGKLAHCWTGPYKVLCVGPGKTNDGREVGQNYCCWKFERMSQVVE